MIAQRINCIQIAIYPCKEFLLACQTSLAGTVLSGSRIKREGGSCREWWQQEQLWERGVAPRANREDLVVLGKVDEIPRTDTLEALRGCQFEAKNDCAILEGSTFQYSYSGYAGPQPGGPKVLPSEVTQLIRMLWSNVC